MTYRLCIAAIFLFAIYGAVRWVRDRGMPTEPAPLEMKVQDLPMTLGQWKGEAVELDPEMFQNMGAEMAMDRVYRDRRGQAVSVHLAVYQAHHGLQGMPHMPDECYSTSGWHLGDPKFISIEQAGTSAATAKLLTGQRNYESVCVLYWYQIDGHVYSTLARMRQLSLGLRGRPTRPPVVKVMLQTSASDLESAGKILMPLANEIFNWTKDFH